MLGYRPRYPSEYERNRSSYQSLDSDMRFLAENMLRDFERSLNRTMNAWNFFDDRSAMLPLSGYNSLSPFYERTPMLSSLDEPMYEPLDYSYEKKTTTRDPDGHILVKTIKKTPGKPWERHVEEYTNKKQLGQSEKQQQQQLSSEAHKGSESSSGSASTGAQQQDNANQLATPQGESNALPAELANEVQQFSQEIDRDLNRVFGKTSLLGQNLIRDWFHDDLISLDSPNAACRFESLVNNNGEVTVKTANKRPGGAWETSVKKYRKEGALDAEKGEKMKEVTQGNAEKQQETPKQAENETIIAEEPIQK